MGSCLSSKSINDISEVNIIESKELYNIQKEKQNNQPIQNEIKSDVFELYTYYNTQEFNLNDKKFKARIVDIYDGDTCICVINLFDLFYKFNIRLAEIDTCEMKSKNADNKELAYKARSRLFELVTNLPINKPEYDLYMKRNDLRKLLNENIYLINIKCGEFDKYGRLLAYLFPNNDSTYDINHSFNHILLNEKLAYKYVGNTKLTEDEQVKYLTIL